MNSRERVIASIQHREPDKENDWHAIRMPNGREGYYPAWFSPEGMQGIDEAMSKVLWSAFVHSPWDHMCRNDFWKEFRNRVVDLRNNTDRSLPGTRGICREGSLVGKPRGGLSS